LAIFIWFYMEAILDRLKARNFPSRRLKEGIRVNVGFQDRRAATDMDRDVILERINRGTVRGHVAKETTKMADTVRDADTPKEPAAAEESKTAVQEPEKPEEPVAAEGAKPAVQEPEKPEEPAAAEESKTAVQEPEKPEEPVAAEGAKPAKTEGSKVAKKSVKMVLKRDTATEETPKEEEAEGVAGAAVEKTSKEEEGDAEVEKTSKKAAAAAAPPLAPAAAPVSRSVLRTSPYYMSNRQRFLDTVHRLFDPYMKELASKEQAISCGKLKTMGDEGADLELLVHQRVARDYLNLYSPYRGLLLYYGLGSGKTLAAITIAEGMKSHKKIVVMTPASLKMNFFTELKRAGDPLYKKNQAWTFVRTVGQPDLEAELSDRLALPLDYVRKKKGAWMAQAPKSGQDVSTSPAQATAFADLSEEDQKAVDDQLNQMIRAKYLDINYNAPNLKRIFADLTDNYTKNPFDGAVIIVDEAHNLVNRIVNQLSRMPKRATGIKVAATTPVSLLLYEYLMSAQDARVVFLSGTPIINTPNEIAVMYNMLRGYIKTWTFTLGVETTAKVTTETLLAMFKRENFETLDYVEYSQNRLTVTRNPFGFVNNTTGVCRPGPVTATAFTKMAKATAAAATRKTKKAMAPPGPGEGVGTTAPGKTTKGGPPAPGVKGGPSAPGARKTKKATATAAAPPPDLGPDPGMMDVDPNPQEEYVIPPHQQYVGDREPHHGGAGQEAVDPAYRGVCLDETGNLDDAKFVAKVKDILRRNGLQVVVAPKVDLYKCLPDNKDAFLDMFVDMDTGSMKQADVFARRILGLTSYFRSPQEGLLPKLVETDQGDVYELVKTDMSDYQLERYSAVRMEEQKKESNAQKMKKKGAAAAPGQELFREFTSTYRIYSRACCNFAWPEPPGRPSSEVSTKEGKAEAEETEPETETSKVDQEGGAEAEAGASDDASKAADDQESNAPLPEVAKYGNAPDLLGSSSKNGEWETTDTDASKAADGRESNAPLSEATEPEMSKVDQEGGAGEGTGDNDLVENVDDQEGEEAASAASIQAALSAIASPDYLDQEHLPKYSPKFAAVLDNIVNEKHVGLHLVYSSFRTLEGIGILRLVLDVHGFQPFTLKKQSDGEWDLAADLVPSQPRYVLYTGTESEEEKEIIRNVYNGTWDLVPPRITKKLEAYDTAGKKNTMGDVIRVLMITAAGAEGINLKNTRYVHIVEPYWNMVRVDQVVGRARRICSHEDLPPELRTVKVFIYLAVFSEAQKKDQKYLNLMNSDLSRTAPQRPVTTDETLYEISFQKQRISQQILGVAKTSSVDCVLYASDKKACFGANRAASQTNDFMSYPSLEDDAQVQAKTVVRKQAVAYRDVTVQGVKYYYNEATGELFDRTTFAAADRGRQPMEPAGKLVKEGARTKIVKYQGGALGPEWTPVPEFTPNAMTGVLTSQPTISPGMMDSLNRMVGTTSYMMDGVLTNGSNVNSMFHSK